ncbi:MAG TPA: hypothetical protein VI700_02710 [Thermoanaerobaculaceae bacterium]|nr:hypothetical protein [Thermoanaerobaculaceae bacterium]
MSVWYQIIVTGSEDALRGFVAGCEAALGGKEAVVFGHDLDLEASTFSQRLLELFAAGSHHLVFAPAKLAEEVAAALRSRGRKADLGLESVREVVRARMPFSAEAFSPDVAERIRQKLLTGLPPGVEGENIEESEERDPSARGAELYTPEHAYVYRVSGTFVGPLPGIIEMRQRARNLPFVKVKALELETRPIDAPGRP